MGLRAYEVQQALAQAQRVAHEAKARERKVHVAHNLNACVSRLGAHAATQGAGATPPPCQRPGDHIFKEAGNAGSCIDTVRPRTSRAAHGRASEGCLGERTDQRAQPGAAAA